LTPFTFSLTEINKRLDIVRSSGTTKAERNQTREERAGKVEDFLYFKIFTNYPIKYYRCNFLKCITNIHVPFSKLRHPYMMAIPP